MKVLKTTYPPFEWVAAKNVAKDGEKKGHIFVDKERLLQLNPEVIFIDGGGNLLVTQDLQKKPLFLCRTWGI